MVAHLLRLKLRLLGNSLRRSPGAVIGLAIGVLYAGALVLLALAGLVILRLAADLELSRQVSVVGGAFLVIAWGTVPVLLYGTDPTLDPSRLAVYPIPPRSLAVGLLVSGIIGVPGAATVLLGLGVVLLWSVSPIGVLAGLLAAVCGVATCLLLSRVLTTAAAGLLGTRRGRDLAMIAGLVVLVMVAPTLNAVVGSGASDQQVSDLADVVGWTPPGWGWAAAADLTAGRWVPGLVRGALAVLLVLGLFAVWVRQTRRLVTSPRGTGTAGPTGGRDDGSLLDRLPPTPAGAVAARSLISWRRDPRMSFPAIVTTIIPGALLGPGLSGNGLGGSLVLGTTSGGPVTGSDLALLAMPVLAAYLLGFGQHNDVGHDSTPFWLHVASGVPGTADRLGRLAPPALLGAVMVPLWALVGSLLSGHPELLPAQLGLSIALLLSGFGVSSVASAVRPYAVPGPGDSPFATPPGSAGVALLVQLVCGIVIAIPCLPVAVVAVLSIRWGAGWGWAALLLGIVLGGLTLWAGVRLGAAWFDRRSAELLQYLVGSR